MTVRLLWQAEDLDRLLDAEHARLVDTVVQMLTAAGWTVLPEVTFQIGSERGSIDILAFHAGAGVLLVVEVKTVVPDVQATLAVFDRKTRLAPRIARERGLPAGPVSRLLVLPHDRTARRRLAAFASTFDLLFPARTVEARRWIMKPAGTFSGRLFVSGATQAGTRHRVRGRSSPSAHETMLGS